MSLPAEDAVLGRLQRNPEYSGISTNATKNFDGAGFLPKKIKVVIVHFILRLYSSFDVIFFRGLVYPIISIINFFESYGTEKKNSKGDRAYSEPNPNGEIVPNFYPFEEWIQIVIGERIMSWYLPFLVESSDPERRPTFLEGLMRKAGLPRFANVAERMRFFHSTFRWMIVFLVLSICIGAYYEYNSRAPLPKLTHQELQSKVFNSCLVNKRNETPVVVSYREYLEYRKNHAQELYPRQIVSLQEGCRVAFKYKAFIKDLALSVLCRAQRSGAELTPEVVSDYVKSKIPTPLNIKSFSLNETGLSVVGTHKILGEGLVTISDDTIRTLSEELTSAFKIKNDPRYNGLYSECGVR